MENNFLTYKTHHRTFDLYNKQWSRYLPAINLQTGETLYRVGDIATLPVRVHPGYFLDLSLGPRLTIYKKENTNMHLACGYNLFYSSGEYLEIMDYEYCCPYQNLKSYGIAGSAPDKTASASTIFAISDDDPVQVPLTINDLDTNLTAKIGGAAHTFFGRCAISAPSCQGIFGGWIEAGNKPGIESRYGVWGGISFSW